jgi:hypothetical protein
MCSALTTASLRVPESTASASVWPTALRDLSSRRVWCNGAALTSGPSAPCAALTAAYLFVVAPTPVVSYIRMRWIQVRQPSGLPPPPPGRPALPTPFPPISSPPPPRPRPHPTPPLSLAALPSARTATPLTSTPVAAAQLEQSQILKQSPPPSFMDRHCATIMTAAQLPAPFRHHRGHRRRYVAR